MTEPELEVLAAMVDGRVFEGRLYSRSPELKPQHCDGCAFYLAKSKCTKFREIASQGSPRDQPCQSQIWQLLPTPKE